MVVANVLEKRRVELTVVSNEGVFETIRVPAGGDVMNIEHELVSYLDKKHMKHNIKS